MNRIEIALTLSAVCEYRRIDARLHHACIACCEMGRLCVIVVVLKDKILRVIVVEKLKKLAGDVNEGLF